jgi:hypothetical protein
MSPRVSTPPLRRPRHPQHRFSSFRIEALERRMMLSFASSANLVASPAILPVRATGSGLTVASSPAPRPVNSAHASAIAYRVPGSPGQLVTLTFTLLEHTALYHNEVGIILVDDASGRIGSLRPGDHGYARAAMSSPHLVEVFGRYRRPGSSVSLTLPAGTMFGFYLVQNSSSARLVKWNDSPAPHHGHAPHVFFSFPAANFDKFGHVRLRRGTSNVYEFEDESFGGDCNFTDDVVGIKFRVHPGPATQPPPSTPTSARLAITFGLDPAFQETSPPSEDHTVYDTVTLDGLTAPGATVTLAGKTVVAGPDGRFQVTGVHLVMGGNPFTAKATDTSGHIATLDRTITLDCGFTPDLAGWTVHQDGGGPSGAGTVTVHGIDAVLHEGNSFDVTLSRPVVISAGATSLTFMYSGPAFDTSSSGQMKDAFEAALVDAQGRCT